MEEPESEYTASAVHGFLPAAQLHAWQAQVIESSVTRNQDGTTSYSMELKMNTDVDPQSNIRFS